MKLKLVISTTSLSLLVLVLLIAFSAPLAAQDTTQEPKPLDKMVSKKTTRDQNDSGKSSPKIALNISKEPASERSISDNKVAPPIYDPDYWFNKGALCATYGNDRAAIKYFQKAISIDPGRSGAYFEQGISYGQLDEFDKALALLNKALEMEPRNGLYLYGRGRVYLLAGETENAREDFKKAAELEDEDSQNYLEMIARTGSEELE